jgi:putative tricarboxylic transport membrane protein
MKTQRSADVVSGCVLVLLGVLVLVAASQIRGGMEERLPPRTLPYIVGSVILAGGAGLALKSWRRPGPGGPGPALKWPDGAAMLRIAVCLAALVLYIVLMPYLGFPITSGIYVAFTIRYLRPSAPWTALLIGVVTGLLSYYVFSQLLELSLPLGDWFID